MYYSTLSILSRAVFKHVFDFVSTFLCHLQTLIPVTLFINIFLLEKVLRRHRKLQELQERGKQSQHHTVKPYKGTKSYTWAKDKAVNPGQSPLVPEEKQILWPFPNRDAPYNQNHFCFIKKYCKEWYHCFFFYFKTVAAVRQNERFLKGKRKVPNKNLIYNRFLFLTLLSWRSGTVIQH